MKEPLGRREAGPRVFWCVFVSLCLLSWFVSCTPEQAGREATDTKEPVSTERRAEVKSPEPIQVEPVVELVQEKPASPEPPKQEPLVEPVVSSEPSAPDAGPVELPPQGTSPITLTVAKAEDVVTSYLLDGSAWNYFSGATVKLGRHSNVGRTSYFTAFRFTGVTIPKGAKITSAQLSFMPHNEVDSSKRLMINIYAEGADDSKPYDPTNYSTGRPDQRLRTKAKIDRWIVRCRADCSDDVSSPKYEYDCKQRKADCWDRSVRYQVPKSLKEILQEVVDQSGWKSGNAISLFLFNAASDREGKDYQDSRTIIGYDPTKAASAPQLVISFE